MFMAVVCVVGVYSGSSGNPSECRSVDPLHQSVAGNTGHEPDRVTNEDSQVDKRTHMNLRVIFVIFVFTRIVEILISNKSNHCLFNTGYVD